MASMMLSACASRQVSPLAKIDPAFDPRLTIEQRREALHRQLVRGGGHDTFVNLMSLGDATSVPFLVELLERYAAPGGRAPMGLEHAIEALQVITNHDRGDAAYAWRAWYDAHRTETQEDWILDGFREAGLPVTMPVNGAFATELVRATVSATRPVFIRTNAQRFLRRQRFVDLEPSLRALSGSASVADRRGVVEALEQVESPARIRYLRALRTDPAIDVAENALRVLNDALRRGPAAPPRQPGRRVQLRDRSQLLAALDFRTLLLRASDRRGWFVHGFDVVSRRATWKYRTDDFVRGAVSDEGRVYLVSDDRVVHCLTRQGRSVWRRALSAVESLSAVAEPAIVGERLFLPDGGSLYAVTRDGSVEVTNLEPYASRSVAGGLERGFAAVLGGPLVVIDAGGVTRRVPTGVRVAHLAAADDFVCLVSVGPKYDVQCLDTRTLQERWRTALPDEAGGYSALLMDEGRVYALAQGRMAVFRAATGERLWADNQFRSFSPVVPLGPVVMTTPLGTGIEWRDADTGEVLMSLPRSPGEYEGNPIVRDGRLFFQVSHDDPRRFGVASRAIPDAIAARARSESRSRFTP